MYQPSFKSCWAKINRAEELRQALEDYTGTILNDKRNHAAMRADADGQTGYHILSLQTVPDLSRVQERTGLIVGDIVHNLRSGLDHLTWQLACHHTGGSPLYPRRIQFSVEDSPSLFAKRCKLKDQLGEIASVHQAIIERYQPYNGLNSPGSVQLWSRYVHELALLRDLSDSDKHRILTTIELPTTGFHLYIRVVGTPLFDIDHSFPADHALKLGAQVMRARFTASSDFPEIEPHMQMVGRAVPQIQLAEGGTVIPDLQRVGAFVAQIVREFEKLSY
jgi:hypothetical protein